jgi:glycine oxidase
VANPITLVGGGLAGLFLASELITRGHHVLLYDQPSPNSGSPVAAGLFNVITGAKPSLTWRAPELVAELNAAFAHGPLSDLAALLYRVPILRMLDSVEAVNDWSSYPSPDAAEFSIHVNDPLAWRGIRPHQGVLRLEGLGWLDAQAFLPAATAALSATSQFTRIDHAYPGDATGPVVYCEGIGINANPLYRGRKLQPLAGDVLHIRLPIELQQLLGPHVLVGGGYLVPRPDGTALLGSTYLPGVMPHQPTAEARASLLATLARWLPHLHTEQVEVLDHWVGIRATTPDRRPLLGRLPDANSWFMNGLGTKGVLHAPLLARWLADALETGELNWPPEVDMFRRALQPRI